ncbi:MAG: PH domain-containing protein [Haloarculaceae archaeon]
METTEPTEELRRNVYDNEEIEWVVQPSATARFAANGIGSLIGGIIGGGVLGFVVFLAITVFFTAFFVLAIPAAIATFVVVLAWTMRRHVARWLFGTTEYAATNARLVKFGGVFGRSFSSIPLEGVQDTQYDISTTENFFDVGTVTVDTEKGYERMAFPYTPAPPDFAREVNSLASRTRQEGTPRLGPEGGYEPGQGIAPEEPTRGLQENLYPDEELLWVITQDKTSRLLTDSPGVVFGALMTGLVFGAIAFGALFGLTRSVSGAAPVGIGVGLFVALVQFGVSVISYYRGSTQYAATDRRLIEYQGRFGKQFNSIPLGGIQDAEYSVSFTENLFDVGTVRIDTDRGYETMALSNVPNPPDVAREITRLAGSGIAERSAVDPSEVSVGDGVETDTPSEDLMQNIHGDEAVKWVITPDKNARLMKNVVQGIPGAAVGGVILGGFLGAFAGVALGPTLGVVVGALVFIGVILLSLYATIKQFLFDKTEYAMTDDRLIDYSGAFGREMSGVPLEGIQDAEYSTTFVEERFDVGDVTVDTHRGYGSISLDAVADPSAIAREISEVANAYRLSDAQRADEAQTQGATEARESAVETTQGGVSASAETAESTGDAAAADGQTAATGAPLAHARKRCRECETEIDVTSTFCPACGTEQPTPSHGEAACENCGARAHAGAQFCRHCGSANPVQGVESD